MSEKIKPALTAEEWREALQDHTAKVQAMRSAWYNPKSPETSDHALAALALYGQPFGFTHEDLTACENGIAGIWTQHSQMCHGDSEECGCGPESRALYSLADRIQALLPREKK